MVRRALALSLLSLAVPTAAQAATVTLDDGVLRYTAAPGFRNNVTFTQADSAVTVTRVGAGNDADADVLTGGAGCTTVTPTAITCPAVTRLSRPMRVIARIA